jgi:hypothetical protein
MIAELEAGGVTCAQLIALRPQDHLMIWSARNQQ